MTQKTRRLPLLAAVFALVAVCTGFSVQAVWANEARSRCDWNYEGDFCEDLNCDPIGFCSGGSPVECDCIIG